ncbi:hypothetical protein R20233_00582 [Ralstonia sp. LMG 32965]|uniref:hypothetical protein n=1 Tax=Ralstonia flatus TaxID=3058601 RepID=UPI0028F62C5F|nr:hypothetical protein [Ralstonia sp. LMG 32965]CAJ0858334.1 hypothetical protein R20233_00582 [Ralstonia sp. LMG 32965]
MKNINPAAYDGGELFDFDLQAFVVRCWKLRRQIILLAAIFFALIFALSFWMGRQYSSEGFMRAPRKFAEYNVQKAAFWDRDTLRRYLEENKKLNDANGQYLLGNLSEGFVQAHLQAVLPLSKDDLRYVTDAKGVLDAIGILGFSITFKDRSPDNAQARVQLMGDYIKDTMLGEDLLDIIYTKAGEAKAKKQQIDNLIIQKRLALAQASSRLEAARLIAGKYPEASKMEARQLLSTGSDNSASRYLSPMAQLVGIETEIADLKSQLTLLERDAEQNALRSEFYERVDQGTRQAKTGSALLAEFVKTAQAVFAGKDLKDDKTREIYNQFMVIAEQMRNKHISEARFVSGPTLPEYRSGPSSLALALLSLIGGVLLASLIVLLVEKVRTSSGVQGNAALDEGVGSEEDSLRPVRVA